MFYGCHIVLLCSDLFTDLVLFFFLFFFFFFCCFVFSSHLPLFWRLCQNYYKSLAIEEKKEGVSALRSYKNGFLKLKSCNLVHTFSQRFTKNPLFFYDEILVIIRSIPPIFSCSDTSARTIRFGHWREKEGPLRKKKSILKLNLRNLVHIFAT